MSQVFARVRRPTLSAEVLVDALLLAVVFATVFASQSGGLAVDTRPDLYLAPWRLLEESLHAWAQAPATGAPNFDTGYAPVALLMGLLQSVGVGPEMSIRLWRFALLVVAALGTRAFVRDVCPEVGVPGRVAATALYVLNPYALVGAATTPVLLPYALFPWFVVLVRRAYRGRRTLVQVAGAVLVFAGMSGMNAGIVPLALLAGLPVIALDCWLREGVPGRRVAAVSAALLGLVVLVSMSWLVPAWSAMAVGRDVVVATETPHSVAVVSSPAEVLRGLGQWLLYGSDAAGAFRPGFVSYVTNPLVVVASFLLPLLGFLGVVLERSRARVLGVGLLVVGTALSVGLYPGNGPSGVNTVLSRAFDHLPGAAAFRTTNKVGAVVILGLVLLAALAVDRMAVLLTDIWVRVAAVVTLIVTALVSVSPMLVGEALAGPLPVPQYWHAAATDMDARASQGRVWFVPGEVSATYRWGRRSVDDLGPSLFERRTIVRTTVPTTPAGAANALAAYDDVLQTGSVPAGAISAQARYLGVSDLLVRNDLVWEHTGGIRPATLSKVLAQDPGLALDAAYGRPGEYVVSGIRLGADPSADDTEASLAPLERFAVSSPVNDVRTYDPAGSVVVVGDNAAQPELAGYGLLDGHREYRLAGDLDDGQLTSALREGARVVLTDSNRRRPANDRRLNESGPLTSAAVPVGLSRALFGAAQQTTLALRPPFAAVRASAPASVFGNIHTGGPALALDGDPATAWRVGDFGTAVDQWWQAEFEAERGVHQVTVTPAPNDAVRASGVRVSVGGRSVDLDVSGGAATATFPAGTRGRAVRVQIVATTGRGFNSVGLSEVAVDGLSAAPTVITPTGWARQVLEAAPVDVLLVRAQAGEHEAAIDRQVQLPVGRTYTVRARLTAPGLTAERADELDGVPEGFRSVASSVQRSDLHVRSSRAFDGNVDTAWVPGGDPEGATILATFTPRSAHSVVVRLHRTGSRSVDRVRIVVDGSLTRTVAVHGDLARLRFTGREVGKVQVQLLGVSGTSGVVGVADVAVGRSAPGVPSSERACRPVVAVGGVLVKAAFDGGAADLASPSGATASGCGLLTLEPGAHRIRAEDLHGMSVDSVYLTDTMAGPVRQESGPTATVVERTPTQLRITAAASGRAFDLVVAESYDPRWTATASDGRQLGRPSPVDGVGMAWRVPAGDEVELTITYGPQRAVVAGYALTLLSLLGVVAMLVAGLVRRSPATRRAPGRGPERLERWSGKLPEGGWWVSGVVLAAVVGGVWAAGTVGVVAGIRAARGVRPRAVLWGSVGTLAAVPFVWLVSNWPRLGQVSFDLVDKAPWPGRLATVSIALLVTGLVLDLGNRDAGARARAETVST